MNTYDISQPFLRAPQKVVETFGCNTLSYQLLQIITLLHPSPRNQQPTKPSSTSPDNYSFAMTPRYIVPLPTIPYFLYYVPPQKVAPAVN